MESGVLFTVAHFFLRSVKKHSQHILHFCHPVWICFFINISTPLLYAQSTLKITGTVADGETRLPVSNANIQIENTGHGTITGINGQFQFDNLLQSTYTLTVSHIGYNPVTLKNIHIYPDAPRHLQIEMQPRTLTMPGIQVFADREKEKQPGIWSLSDSEIRNSSAQDVAGLLQQAPGVEIINNGPGAGRHISIRGSRQNQVLVLLDGVPINPGLDGTADLSHIPVHMIEKIEVYTGPASHRFGSGALAGAVNIITRRRIEHSLHIKGSCGSWQQQSITPSLSLQYNNLDLNASWQHRYAQNHYKYDYQNSAGELVNDTRDNADIKAGNLFLRSGYEREKHYFSMIWQQLNSDRGLPGKTDGWTPWARSGYNQHTTGFDYQYTTKGIQIYLQPRSAFTYMEQTNLYPADAPLRYKRYPQYHYKDRHQRSRIDSRVVWQVNDHYQLSAGHAFQRQTYDHENLMPSVTTVNLLVKDKSHGVFTELHWQRRFSNWLLLAIPAVRYDQITSHETDRRRTDKQWSPALHTRIAYGDRHRLVLTTSLARSFRAPTFADLFYQDVRMDGNPDLLPESAFNREGSLGYEWHNGFRLLTSVTRFQQDIDNLIVWRLGSFQVFRPYNSKARLSGTEYRLEMSEPEQYINLSCSYSVNQPLVRNDNITTRDNMLPYRASRIFKGNVELNYKHVFLNIRYRYGGKRYINEANTKSLDPYQVWDIDAGYTVNLGPVATTCRGSILNLSYEKYTIIRDMPLPGREWRLSMEFTLNNMEIK